DGNRDLVHRDLRTDGDVPKNDIRDRGDAQLDERPYVQGKYDAPAVTLVAIAELQLNPTRYRHGRVLVEDAHEFHLLARADLDRDVLRGNLHQALELLGEDRWPRVGRRRVMSVAAT